MKHNGGLHSWYLRKSAKYGDVFSVKMGSNLIVCIGSAKIMKELFYRQDSTARPDTPLINLMGGFGELILDLSFIYLLKCHRSSFTFLQGPCLLTLCQSYGYYYMP